MPRKIVFMMIDFYATDRFGNPKGRLGYVSSAVRNRTVEGTDTLTIECSTPLDKGDRIVFLDPANNVREYIITDYDISRTDALKMTYYASNSVMELGVFVIEDRRVRDGAPTAALTRLLDGTRWQVGTVEINDVSVADISFYHTNALDGLKDISEKYHLEIVTELGLNTAGNYVTSRKINLLKQQGNSVPRRFEFGRNLPELTRKIDSADVITRLYPYGKGLPETDDEGEETGGYGRKIDISSVNAGKTYIEDTTATSVWGVPNASGQVMPAMGVVDFPEIETPAELLTAAKTYLKTCSSPKASYTASVSVLGIETVDRLGLGVGDVVQVIDTQFPSAIRLEGRVLEITDNLLNPLSDDTKITLGNLSEKFTKTSSSVTSTVNKLWSGIGIWTDAAGLRPDYLNGVINGLNNQMNETGGYTYLTPNNGIIVYDKPRENNPTMAMQLSGYGFRIANSKTSSGDWNWRTFGTGSGFTADMIVAGKIVGGSNIWNLETGELDFSRGVIKDRYGRTSWNLTTGEFTGRNVTMSGVLRNINSVGTGVELDGYELRGFQTNTKTFTLDPNITFVSGQQGARLQGEVKYLGIGAQQMYVTRSHEDNGTTLAWEEIKFCTDMASGGSSWINKTRTFVNGLMLGVNPNAASADVAPTSTFARAATWLDEATPGIMEPITQPETAVEIVENEPVYQLMNNGDYRLVSVPDDEKYAALPMMMSDDIPDVKSMSADEICGIQRVELPEGALATLQALVALSQDDKKAFDTLINSVQEAKK